MNANTASSLMGPFIAKLGAIEIIRDSARLIAFAADSSGRRGATPLAVARPADTAQVQQIFQAAIAHGVKLIPVSSPGGPRRRGDTISDTPSVIVDLSAMNKIMHVDGQNAIALIEAGVTFPQFNAALASHGLRSFQPLRPRASKSVLAAFLERDATTVPGKHWDSTDPLAAMEIVFGEGDLFRTGGAAAPGKLEDNIAAGNRQMTGLGPVLLDFGRVVQGAQGALGIVTWASIYCQAIPAIEVPLLASGNDLEPLVELAYRLLRRRINGQLFLLNRTRLALLLARNPAHFAALTAGLPAWTLYLELSAPAYFPEQAIAYQRELLDQDAARIGVPVSDTLAGEPASAIAAAQRAYSDESCADRAGLAEQELLCMSQLNRVPAQMAALGAAPDGADWAVYLQPMVHGVNAQCQFSMVGPHGTIGLAEAARRGADRLADAGAFFSRPYHPYAALPFARDPAALQMLERTKKLLDPNRVLQAGAMSLGRAA